MADGTPTPARPTSGAGLFAAAAVLTVLGLVGIVLYAAGAPDLLADGGALGGLRALLIIASALLIGSGAVLATTAVLRRRRRATERAAR